MKAKTRHVGALLGAMVLGMSSSEGVAATCPFNIPVVTLPPHQTSGFSWGSAILPQEDACVTSIAVEPTSDLAWYVGGFNGLYLTKNGGQTWTKPLSGQVGALLLVPGAPQLVYAGVGKKLLLSRNKGMNWNVIGTFPEPIASLLVVGGRLFVGLGFRMLMPSTCTARLTRAYISTLYTSLGVPQTQLSRCPRGLQPVVVYFSTATIRRSSGVSWSIIAPPFIVL